MYYMLNIVKLNLLNSNKTCNTVKKVKTLNNFPSSIREWNNSLFFYNKKNLDLIPTATISAINIIKSYFLLFNYGLERKIRKKRLKLKFRRLSSNKIFISNGEFKHTNNKVIVNLYIYNRQRYNYILALKKLYLNKILYLKTKDKFKNKFNSVIKYNEGDKNKLKYKFKSEIKRKNNIDFKFVCYVFNLNNKNYKLIDNKAKRIIKRTKYKPKLVELNEVNKYFKWSNFNKSLIRKINKIKNKSLLLFKLFDNEKYLIINKLRNNKKVSLFISSYIFTYYKKFIKISLQKLKLYFYYKQLLHVNRSKLNYSFLQYLNKYLYSLYNKNIEYNLINLKHFHLHTDILSESMKLKITRNRTRMLKKFKTLKKKINIYNKSMLLHDEVLERKSSEIPSFLTRKKNIIYKLRYKYITGFRLEIAGRLTKRRKASRSLLKTVYKGNLLDLKSSYKRWPNVLLKGNLESNLQQTKLRSKSNIGSFGIKGWISGN